MNLALLPLVYAAVHPAGKNAADNETADVDPMHAVATGAKRCPNCDLGNSYFDQARSTRTVVYSQSERHLFGFGVR